MSGLRPDVEARYGHRVRVRVGGLIFDDPVAPSAAVLVEHRGMYGDEPFWTPPGGEVGFGESLADALQREIMEETRLEATIGPLRYVLDFVRPPLHAVSFYFEAAGDLAALAVGNDPEFSGEQLIQGVELVPFREMQRLRVYPEGLPHRLGEDAEAGFPDGLRYLGTLR